MQARRRIPLLTPCALAGATGLSAVLVATLAYGRADTRLGMLGVHALIAAPRSSRRVRVRRRIPVQEMIARVDQVLNMPEGLLTGRLSAVTRHGDSAVWEFNLYKKTVQSGGITERALLYQFSSKRRGLEAKILFREDGEVVWVWDQVRRRLFRKRDLEKFQGVLGTGFSYIDLSGAGFQAAYTGRSVKELPLRPRPGQSGKRFLTRLTMLPINRGRYSRLLLLADPALRYRPLRIDYHGKRRVLFKTLRFYYGDLLMKRTGRTTRVRLPTRLEMLDLQNGMISRLEYFTLDRTVKPENAFFDHEYLSR